MKSYKAFQEYVKGHIVSCTKQQEDMKIESEEELLLEHGECKFPFESVVRVLTICIKILCCCTIYKVCRMYSHRIHSFGNIAYKLLIFYLCGTVLYD
jgi:hypothetical protein